MKHLLNNLSEEEKNSIREQHTDKIKIDTSKFKTLRKSKLGDVKPITEQVDQREIELMKKQKELEDRLKEVQRELEKYKGGSNKKRLHDKMVVDCLVKDGFKAVYQEKYDVYMVKGKGSQKLVVTSQENPNRFFMNLLSQDKKSLGSGDIEITPGISCEDIVGFANKPRNMFGADY